MRSIVVIPCYNEAQRLNCESLLQYVSDYPEDSLLLVDDGSVDETAAIIQGLSRQMPESISTLMLPRNCGKAEAVRQGVLKALEADVEFVGYWDADLATPLLAVSDFIATFDEHPAIDLIMGSRVKLLGRVIERNPLRHYLGRVFANLASHTLSLAVYDTQCGAKMFRRRPWATKLFREPFCSRWIFDVELLARYLTLSEPAKGGLPEEGLYELPLKVWRDVPGSKVRPRDFLRAVWELAVIRYHYRPQRRSVQNQELPVAASDECESGNASGTEAGTEEIVSR